ncbi:MAG: MFS transporter [Sphaerobacter sp.]|nr:MFS transporter [Sphaerobacter sp.]
MSDDPPSTGQPVTTGETTPAERSALGATPDIVPGRHKWLVLSAVSVGTFMATLDGSIVNISLPQIQQAFGVNLSAVEWVVIAYLLVLGTLLLPFGRLGDLVGYRQVYLSGFALFTVASALCGAAQSIWMLVGFRALQAVGGSMLQAMGPAIVTRTFGARERGKALGLNAVSVAIGLSLGPALGGALTEFASWRWIFYINLPVGVFAILWTWRVLEREHDRIRQRFDIPGAVLSFGALFALLLALIEGQRWGWRSLPIVGLLVLAAVLGAAFVLVELRSRQPMLDLRLFRIRPFWAGNVSLLIVFAGLFTATFLLPFFLQQGQGRSPLAAGLLLTPVPLTTLVIGPLSGALSDRIGSRLPATLGAAVMTLGLYSLTQLHVDASMGDLIWRLVVLGVGQGLFFSPNSSAILGSVPRPRIGTASAMLAQMRINGQVLGIAAAGAIVATRLPTHMAELASRVPPAVVQRDAFVLAIHDAFAVAAAISVIAIVTSLLRGARR